MTIRITVTSNINSENKQQTSMNNNNKQQTPMNKQTTTINTNN